MGANLISDKLRNQQHLGTVKIKGNIWKLIWKMAVFQSVIITAKRTSNHLRQQDVHGCLRIPREEHLQTEYYIHWWKVPERMNWMCMSI